MSAWSYHGVDWDQLDGATRAVLREAGPRPLSSPVPTVKGHTLRHQNGQAWCACGHYIAGLGTLVEPPGFARDRHELHVAAVLATAAAGETAPEPSAPRTPGQPDLFSEVA